MIGSGLKNYAKENGLKVAKGVAYGSFRGYAVTMSEGTGYKQVIFATKFNRTEAADELLAEVNTVNIQRTYRVQGLEIAPSGIVVSFTDNPGTMRRIKAFMDWFVPLLEQFGATHYDVCGECGLQVTSGRWVLIDGVAFYLHEACLAKVRREAEEDEEQQRMTNSGSYATGAAGAFVGSLLGAVVWGIVLCIGYMASVVGLLIGWLANKGYDLMRGKRGKGKIAILALAVVIGVLAGTMGGYAIALWSEANKYLEELSAQTIPASQILPLFMDTLSDGEFAGYVLKDILIGLLFAAIGVYAMLKRTNDEVAGMKILVLE